MIVAHADLLQPRLYHVPNQTVTRDTGPEKKPRLHLGRKAKTNIKRSAMQMAQRGRICFATLTFSNEFLGVVPRQVYEVDETTFLPPDDYFTDGGQHHYVQLAKKELRVFQTRFARKWGHRPTMITKLELGEKKGRVHLHIICFLDEWPMFKESWTAGFVYTESDRYNGDECVELESLTHITTYITKYVAKESTGVFSCPSTEIRLPIEPVSGNLFSISKDLREWVNDATLRLEDTDILPIMPFLREPKQSDNTVRTFVVRPKYVDHVFDYLRKYRENQLSGFFELEHQLKNISRSGPAPYYGPIRKLSTWHCKSAKLSYNFAERLVKRPTYKDFLANNFQKMKQFLLPIASVDTQPELSSYAEILVFGSLAPVATGVVLVATDVVSGSEPSTLINMEDQRDETIVKGLRTSETNAGNYVVGLAPLSVIQSEFTDYEYWPTMVATGNVLYRGRLAVSKTEANTPAFLSTPNVQFIPSAR